MNNVRGPVILDNGIGTPASPGGYFGFGQTTPVSNIVSSGPRLYAGAGNPNGVLTAPIGSFWFESATGVWYRNTDGATAWSAVSGGGSGSYLIYDSGYLAATSATMTTGALVAPADTVHLSWLLLQRYTGPATYYHTEISLNADAADANYIGVQSLGDPAVGVLTAPISRFNGVAGARFIGSAPGAGSGASRYGIIEGTVPFYGNATRRKMAKSISYDFRTAAGEEFITTSAVERGNAAAVTSLTFAPEAGGLLFDTGSRLMVYAQ